MDNAYILLLILKKGVNVGAFIYWVNKFIEDHSVRPYYNDYLHDDTFDVISYNGHTYQNRDRLGTDNLEQFEFYYLISYLSIMGYICLDHLLMD